MASFNRIIIIGNLTRDPEYKQLTSGQAVTRLGVASNRNYKNKQTGSMIQEVCFVDVDVFGPQAESCRQYLQKGRPVLIEGRLKYDQWQSPDGQTRSKHSIVADRVVFLATATAEVEQDGSIDDVGADVEMSAQDKASKIKAAQKIIEKAQGQSKAKEAKGFEATGEFEFKDEQPFEDDLPF